MTTLSSAPSPLRRARTDRATPVWRSLLAVAAVAVTVWFYLFVSAPPLLASGAPSAGTLPIAEVFAMLEHENDAARALWTEEIVQRGGSVGLVFDEHWRDQEVHAGPLPALFLRETARNLERTPMGLSLFLGSPYPVNTANLFTGTQAMHYGRLVESGAPQHFFEDSTRRWTAMFSDVAVSDACVTCHNQHEDSPKRDWQRGEVMGATTWMYPDAEVTTARAIELISTLRQGIRLAYRAYLDEVATFARGPAIGTRWPCEGFALPSEDVFMAELARRSSASTLLALLEPGHAIDLASEVARPPLACGASPRPSTLAANELVPERTPTLVIRSERSTRVTVEQDGRRLLIARLVSGGMTAVSSGLPLRLVLSDAEGVTVEYRGQPLVIPEGTTRSVIDGIEVVVGEPSQDKS